MTEDLSDSDSGIFSATDNEASESDNEDEGDVSEGWRGVHQAIKSTIAELGGKVVPKLNWSAPKDATWIAATNSMECMMPNDVYLLLKSSDFITHDLDHAFDDCEGDEALVTATAGRRIEELVPCTVEDIPYHLVLRKHVQMNPSLEFRCFVRRRQLIAICQRDLNHFDFLFKMRDNLRAKIQTFFDVRLRDTFPDENFVFDVYVPPPHQRVWLVDVNPWAQRTDPLLFSWLELLTMPDRVEPPTARLYFNAPKPVMLDNADDGAVEDEMLRVDESDDTSLSDEEEDMDDLTIAEFRLIHKDDPEAYGFTTPQYSAHKLPKDVVDASSAGPGPMRQFADQWKEALARERHEDETDSEDE